jgi:predicted GNAT family acetyltransferase
MEQKMVTNSLIEDNPTYSRYEMPIADGHIAAAYYRIEGENVVLVHTEVPFDYSGEGIGSKFAKGVFDAIRQSGQKRYRLVLSWPNSPIAIRNTAIWSWVDGCDRSFNGTMVFR